MRNASRLFSVSTMALALALALGAVSCGEEGDSDTVATEAAPAAKNSGSDPRQDEKETPPKGNEAPKGAPSSPAPGGDSGDRSSQFRVEEGDNSIQDFGSESDLSELEAAATGLHGFLDARAAGEWERACEFVAEDVVESLQRFAAQSGQPQKGCPELLRALMGPIPAAERAEAAEADVGALRVNGARAFLLYHGPRNTDYAISMANEDGRWKVAALAGTPLS